MTNINRLNTLALMLLVVTGCASQRADRTDDEAMMIFRDCMNSMPGQRNAFDYTASLSRHDKEAINASLAATARTQKDQREQIHCMQQAGWED